MITPEIRMCILIILVERHPCYILTSDYYILTSESKFVSKMYEQFTEVLLEERKTNLRNAKRQRDHCKDEIESQHIYLIFHEVALFRFFRVSN